MNGFVRGKKFCPSWINATSSTPYLHVHEWRIRFILGYETLRCTICSERHVPEVLRMDRDSMTLLNLDEA